MTPTHTRSLWHDWRRRGDERAFENLVVREVPYAADLARRTGASGSEADDAVQEALARLARERSDEPVHVGLRAWLCRRTILAFKMHVRASTRRRKHERAAPTAAPTYETEGPVELGASVNQALRALPDELRYAVVLRHMHDMDYGAMAHVLGISRGACRLRVFRGIKALRRFLGTEAATMVAMVGVPGFVTSVAPASVATSATTGATAVAGTSAAASTGLGTKAAAGVAAAVAVAGGAAVLLPESAPPPAEPVPVVAAPPPAEERRPDPPPVRRPRPAPALALLDAHLAGTRDATETLWDFAAVDALLGAPEGVVVRPRAGTVPFALATLARDAGRIEFGPGRHLVDGTLLVRARGVLELVGAGMDRTTLVLAGASGVRVGGTLAGLRVRGLTIEGGRFLTVHGRGAATFERVRFRGWPDRSGFGAPIGTGGASLLACRDCEFLGGHRRRPNGRALAVRGASLALFQRCTFRDLPTIVTNGHPGAPHARSLAHFDACRVEACALVRRDDRDADAYPMRMRGGAIAYGLAREAPARRLAAVGAGRVRLDADVRLVPEPPRITLADVRAMLAAVPPALEGITAMEVRLHPGDAHPRVVLSVRGERRMQPAGVFAWRDGALTRMRADAEIVGHTPAFAPGRGASLRALLEEAWPSLDPAESSGGVAIHRTGSGRAVLVFLDRFARRRR